MVCVEWRSSIIEIPQTPVLICPFSLLKDPGSYGFSVEMNGEQVEGFVVRSDGQCFAYRNSCPHTGAPLDWVEHQFLEVEGALIQCAVHDARFLIETGQCVFGPCPGASLEALPIRVQDDNIYLLNEA